MTHSAPSLRTLPSRSMLAVGGDGPPDSPSFGHAVRALFAVRAALGGGDVPLEGTYSQPDGGFDLHSPAGWRWTLAVPAPQGVRHENVASAVAAASAADVHLVHHKETLAVEAEHHGPYDEEGPCLDALRDDAAARGMSVSGPHTETYLNDPNSTPPEELRTLLRYPVAAGGVT